MTSPPRRRILPRLEAPAAPPRNPPVLSDDLLETILLRVSSPADLARATATCRSFSRIITDPSFHRRYRSLHPPLLLGIFCNGIQPAAAPHRNAPAARSLAGAAAAGGFSFDYLPGNGNRWQHSYVCDGRVLLERLPKDEDGVFFPDLAVCDPVHRRFRLLPPIPQDLIAHVKAQENRTRFLLAFLVPSGNQEETSFKVIARTHCEAKLVLFVFSSDSGLWSVGTSIRWADLGFLPTPANFVMGWPQYEHGSFYWKVNWRNKLLKLDIERMEFSTVNLPPGNNEREVVAVEAGQEGRLGMFSLTRYRASMYYFTSMKSKGEGENEWLLESTIPLPCNCNIVGKFEGYVFLLGVHQEDQGIMQAVCFSLEIKTLKIERINSIDILYIHVHPYFGYPPFMSPRRIEVD